MADSTIELRAPLPDGAARASLTWLAQDAKAAATTRDRAVAASLTSYSKSSIASTVRLSLDEADAYLADAETLRNGGTPPPRRPAPTDQPPTRTSTPTPRRPSPTAPAPRTPATRSQTPGPATPSAASDDRTICTRCGSALGVVTPMHLVHVEDLDGFYRKAFDPAMLATSTVYRYQCEQCHAIELFGTPT